MANRLKLIGEWVRAGGGLGMIGGYFSFQGIDGRARWRRTAVEDALPVTCLPYDDRLEIPEGFTPEVVDAAHPLVQGLGSGLAGAVGRQRSCAARPGCSVVARLPADNGGHPLLVAGSHGAGRTLAWTSDIGPHWLPETFVQWPGYATLWRNVLAWLTRTV